MWRKLFSAAVLAAGIGLGGATAAEAGDFCYKYVKVVTYRVEHEPYTKWGVIVDDYGCQREVPRVYYRTVKVPVVKWVKVCY